MLINNLQFKDEWINSLGVIVDEHNSHRQDLLITFTNLAFIIFIFNRA